MVINFQQAAEMPDLENGISQMHVAGQEDQSSAGKLKFFTCYQQNKTEFYETITISPIIMSCGKGSEKK